jgi:predicted O-linked N-acetylglucosamine transferase (SPINDLY family)
MKFITQLSPSLFLSIFIIYHYCAPVVLAAITQKQHELETKLKELFEQAQKLPPRSPEQLEILQKVLTLHPQNIDARVILSSHWITQGPKEKNEAGKLIKEILVNAPQVLTMQPYGPAALYLTAVIGRDLSERKEFDDARFFLEKAFEASKSVPWGYSSEGNLCIHLMLASLWNYWPISVDIADQSLKDLNKWAISVLNRTDFDLHEKEMSQSMMAFRENPFGTCLQGVFPLSLYYRADTAALASRHYEMAAKVWPNLSWTSPHLLDYQDAAPSCNRKTKLAVLSAVFTHGHPVTEDFQGVLQRLDRDKFHVTYIFLEEQMGSRRMLDPFVKANPQDELIIYSQRPDELGRGDWIKRIGMEIADLRFDIVLHLDLTMSSFNRRLGMMKLAPVQINTHGHPITSGHPNQIIQYFISWAEAELPYDEAQQHYTEELKLIPMGKIHQYYKPRRLPGDISRVDGQPFGHLTRDDFDLPSDSNIYLNMQKPFKLHPEFDPLVCGILKKDPNALLVLHRADAVFTYATDESHHMVFVHRLEKAGCDMNRVHFLPSQPHHRLMALIGLSTVVLDSYPAGGCTTTREVFEMGKAVVTLPARLLGSRWTLGLYSILGMRDLPVIATTEQEYIDLAVQLGTNSTLRASVENTIIEKVQTMFYRDEAVEEWEKILQSVSPVQCSGTNDEKDEL